MERIDKPKLLFRASGSGALCVNPRGETFTKTDLKEVLKYESMVKNRKPLTDDQRGKYGLLKKKRDSIPPLSDTAKKFVRELWLLREKGIRYEVTTKYMEKGKWAEHAAFDLLSKVDRRMYRQNHDDRRENGVFTGLADWFSAEERWGFDTKCSWNASTFMESKLTTDNEWQARIYMELYDLDIFYVKYCLVDAPEHIYNDELFKYCRSMGVTDPEALTFDQRRDFRRGLIYTTDIVLDENGHEKIVDNPMFTAEERIKSFRVERDEAKMSFLYDKVKLAIEYYNSLTLNTAIAA